MKWVLLIFALIGLLLLDKSPGQTRQAASPSPDTVVVLELTQNSSRFQLTAIQVVDGQEVWTTLLADLSYAQPLGLSPDGRWLYVQVSEYIDQRVAVVRVGADGPPLLERLAAIHPADYATLSPDGAWLVYEGWDPSTYRKTLMRAASDGSTAQVLTSGLTVNLVDYPPSSLIISPENDWVAFNAGVFSNNVFVADTRTGEWAQVTHHPQPTYVHGHVRNATGDWLIVSAVDGVHAMRLDGSEKTRLLAKEPDGMKFWEEARLILVKDDQTDMLHAIGMDDFAVRWGLREMNLPRPQVMHTQVLTTDYDRVFYSIRADGTAARVDLPIASYGPYTYSPDGCCLVYMDYDTLYAASIETGVRHLLVRPYHFPGLDLVWAADGHSVVVEGRTENGYTVSRVWLESDRKEILVTDGSYFHYLGTVPSPEYGLYQLPQFTWPGRS